MVVAVCLYIGGRTSDVSRLPLSLSALQFMCTAEDCLRRLGSRIVAIDFYLCEQCIACSLAFAAQSMHDAERL